MGKYLVDLEEMHIHYKNLCLVSSANSANFYSSLYEGDFEIDGSLTLPKLPNISKITYETKIKNKPNKTKIHKNEIQEKIRERRNRKKITTQAFQFLYLK